MSQGSDGALLPRKERYPRNVLRALHYGGSGVIVIMMLLTVAHAAGRYGFNLPVPGIIELSSYMLVTCSFLLIGYTMVERRHISIGIIVDRFSERAQAVIDIFTHTVGLAVAAVIVWQTFVQATYMMQRGGLSSSIWHIPVFPFYYIAVIGWVMVIVAIIIRIVYFILAAVKK